MRETVKPLDFNLELNESLIPAIISEMEKDNHVCSWSSPGNLKIFLSSGKHIREYKKTCYIFLRNLYPEKGITIDFIVERSPVNANSHHKSIKMPYMQDYLAWLANESVWANFFVTKDPAQISKIGAIINTKGAPANAAYQAMYAVRYTNERPEIPYYWHRLRHLKAPHLQLIIAHHLTQITDDYMQLTTRAHQMQDRFTLEHAHNMMKGNWYNQGELVTNSFRYGALDGQWQKPRAGINSNNKGIYNYILDQIKQNTIVAKLGFLSTNISRPLTEEGLEKAVTSILQDLEGME